MQAEEMTMQTSSCAEDVWVRPLREVRWQCNSCTHSPPTRSDAEAQDQGQAPPSLSQAE